MTQLKHFEREALIWTSRIDAESKLILLALNQYLGSNHSAWPSIRKLAYDTSLSEPTIKRRLNRLSNSGIVEITHRYIKGMKISSEYTILWSAIGVVGVCLDPQTNHAKSDRSPSPDDAKSDRSPSPDDAKSDSSGRPIVVSGRPIVVSGRPIDLTHRSDPKDLTQINQSRDDDFSNSFQEEENANETTSQISTCGEKLCTDNQVVATEVEEYKYSLDELHKKALEVIAKKTTVGETIAASKKIAYVDPTVTPETESMTHPIKPKPLNLDRSVPPPNENDSQKNEASSESPQNSFLSWVKENKASTAEYPDKYAQTCINNDKNGALRAEYENWLHPPKDPGWQKWVPEVVELPPPEARAGILAKVREQLRARGVKLD